MDFYAHEYEHSKVFKVFFMLIRNNVYLYNISPPLPLSAKDIHKPETQKQQNKEIQHQNEKNDGYTKINTPHL